MVLGLNSTGIFFMIANLESFANPPKGILGLAAAK
jgi:hypothetical protein